MPLFAIPFPAIDPIAVSIGPFAIHWYALAYVFGFLGCWAYASALVRNNRLWGDTPHPTSRPLPEVRLRELRATHPDPDNVRRLLHALDVELDLAEGPAALHAVLDTPNGPVAL